MGKPCVDELQTCGTRVVEGVFINKSVDSVVRCGLEEAIRLRGKRRVLSKKCWVGRVGVRSVLRSVKGNVFWLDLDFVPD